MNCSPRIHFIPNIRENNYNNRLKDNERKTERTKVDLKKPKTTAL
jgi:hypothetical protein